MEKKEAYREKKEAQLRIFNAKLEELKARGAKAKAEAKIEFLNQVENLQEKQDLARKKLSELAASGEETWKNLQASVEVAFEELKKAIDSARGKDEEEKE